MYALRPSLTVIARSLRCSCGFMRLWHQPEDELGGKILARSIRKAMQRFHATPILSLRRAQHWPVDWLRVCACIIIRMDICIEDLLDKCKRCNGTGHIDEKYRPS